MKNADLVKEIFRESKNLRFLNHPNIIKLYHAFIYQKDFVLIMEYAAGGELKDYVRQKGGCSEPQAQSIMRQITYAIYYCHSKGVIHRDLKPQNVLFSNQNYDDPQQKVIKVVDFGIAGYC